MGLYHVYVYVCVCVCVCACTLKQKGQVSPTISSVVSFSAETEIVSVQQKPSN